MDSDMYSENLHSMHDFLSGKNVEQYWRDRWEMLRTQGYILVTDDFRNTTARTNTGAVATVNHCNTARCAMSKSKESVRFGLKTRPNMTIAYRVSDGQLVYIKRIMMNKKICQESENSVRLFRWSRCIDSANHSMPTLEVLEDEVDKTFALAVMPYMPDSNSGSFESIQEVIDFVGQILLGLEFMHVRFIAHCDLSIRNIVVDHNGGINPTSRPTGFRLSKLSRLRNTPSYHTNAKYYILESGLSQYQPPEDLIPEAEPYIVYSGHRDVPEYQKGLRENPETTAIWYNPFQLDVFMVGNMFLQEILSRYSNVQFLQQLVDQMTHNDRRMRPSASESVLEWMSIVQRIPSYRRGHRLRRHHTDEPRPPSGKLEQSGLSIPVTTDRLTHRLQDIAKKAFRIASRNRSASVDTT